MQMKFDDKIKKYLIPSIADNIDTKFERKLILATLNKYYEIEKDSLEQEFQHKSNVESPKYFFYTQKLVAQAELFFGKFRHSISS